MLRCRAEMKEDCPGPRPWLVVAGSARRRASSADEMRRPSNADGDSAAASHSLGQNCSARDVHRGVRTSG